MKTVLFYLLQVITCSGLLYGYYHLFLRNKKFHQYNRFFLLGAIMLSVLIPFINIPVYFTETETQSSVVLQTLQRISYPGSENGEAAIIMSAQPTQSFNWNILLYTVYGAIAVFFFIRIFLSLNKIIAIAKNNPREKLEGISFVNTNEPGTPFSFFSWLFWNRKIELRSQKGEQVFRHEIFHIRQKHSWDIIFMELLIILFWFNPFFHLMKKEIRAIHEFLADQFAVKENDKWDYAELLLMQAFNTQQHLVTPFFHTQIKRRIAMITSSQQPRYQYLRKILVLPLFAIIFFLFAFTYKQVKEENVPTGNDRFNKNEVFTDTVPAGKGFIGIADSATVDNKGDRITLTADSIIIKLPKDQSVGKQPLYIIDGKIIKEGNALNEIAPEQIKSITVLKDATAIAQYGKDGVNGVIEIKTKDEAEIVSKNNESPKEVVVIGYKAERKITDSVRSILLTEKPLKSPLYVVDGVKLAKNEVQEIPVARIISVNVLKGDKATELYGVKGKDGVVLINTKKNVSMEEVVVTDNVKELKTPGKKTVIEVPIKEIVVQGYPVPNASKSSLSPAASVKEVTVIGRPKETTTNDLEKLNPIYPNPATNSFAIPVTAPQSGTGVIFISDLSGRVLLQENTSITKGKNTLDVNASKLANGTYLVTLIINGNSKSPVQQVYKLVKQ